MAFTAFSLEKSPQTEVFVSKVMQGHAKARSEKGGLLGRLEMREHPEFRPEPDKRLFSVDAQWYVPQALWIMGFIGGLLAYGFLGYSWLLGFVVLSLLVAYLFTSSFLRFVLRVSFRKHGYSGVVEWYNAEEFLRLLNWRVIASTQYDDEEEL